MPTVEAFLYVNLISCDTSGDIGLDLCVEVDVLVNTAQRHDQRIPRLAVVPPLGRPVLPPTRDRIDRERAACRELGTRPGPHVAMQ